jgi:hypothetical protein
MATPDHPADSAAHLKREMAVLTADFATEQAVERLRRAIKLGQTVEIIKCANHAATAVKEVADLVTLPDEDADTSVTVHANVTGCLNAMTHAEQAGDADGVLSAAELVGDAVVNYAAFLKNGVPR